MNFLHSGKLGDLIYALPAVKGMQGGPHDIYCCSRPIVGTFTQEWLDAIRPLLLTQPYIRHVAFHTGELIDYDFTNFRHFRYGSTLAENQCRHIQHGAWNIEEPWLFVEPQQSAMVVINRSLRYHNDQFQWKPIVDKYGDDLLFLGLRDEHTAFEKEFGGVNYMPLANLLRVAEVIAGSPLFIGNQSAPMAIAQALKHPLIQETWPIRADCVFPRANAQYVTEGHGILPEI